MNPKYLTKRLKMSNNTLRHPPPKSIYINTIFQGSLVTMRDQSFPPSVHNLSSGFFFFGFALFFKALEFSHDAPQRGCGVQYSAVVMA